MITVSGVSLQFGSRKLFEDVNLKFNKGNCYGVIGANGAGKSTFMKILSGEIEPNKGEIIIPRTERLSVLEQNQEKYNDCTAVRTVFLISMHRYAAAMTEHRNTSCYFVNHITAFHSAQYCDFSLC